MSLKQVINLNDDVSVNEASAAIQKDELANLSAIYMQDMEIVKAKAPIRISIYLEPYLEEDSVGSQNIVKASLIVDIPVDYPVRQQRLGYEFDGITSHFTKEMNMKAIQICESVLKQHEKNVEEKEFGLGYQPIIYHLSEALRNEYENFQKRETDNILYIPPMPKFATSTPVTEETFLVWKRKFEQELFEAKKQTAKFQLEDELSVKISGRQYFERRHKLATDGNVENEEEANIDEDDEEVNVQDLKQAVKEEEEALQRLYQNEEEEEYQEEEEDEEDIEYGEEDEEEEDDEEYQK